MKKETTAVVVASDLFERSPFRGWKALGQALTASAALLCATLNISASTSHKGSEPAAYRQVAFVGTAVAKSTSGQVEYLSGTRWLPAKTGQVFSCEQLCRTKGNGKAIFQLRSSGSLVRIGENTIARFCALDQEMSVASLTGYEATGNGATVRAVRGVAEFLNENSKWQSIRVNTILPSGASVRTLDKSTMDLFFAESGLVMRISPDSRVTLNRVPLVAVGEIQTNGKNSAYLAQMTQ